VLLIAEGDAVARDRYCASRISAFACQRERERERERERGRERERERLRNFRHPIANPRVASVFRRFPAEGAASPLPTVL